MDKDSILITVKEAKIILNLLKRIPQNTPLPTQEELDVIIKLQKGTKKNG